MDIVLATRVGCRAHDVAILDELRVPTGSTVCYPASRIKGMKKEAVSSRPGAVLTDISRAAILVTAFLGKWPFGLLVQLGQKRRQLID